LDVKHGKGWLVLNAQKIGYFAQLVQNKRKIYNWRKKNGIVGNAVNLNGFHLILRTTRLIPNNKVRKKIYRRLAFYSKTPYVCVYIAQATF
jgi:hypothetical protein